MKIGQDNQGLYNNRYGEQFDWVIASARDVKGRRVVACMLRLQCFSLRNVQNSKMLDFPAFWQC